MKDFNILNAFQKLKDEKSHQPFTKESRIKNDENIDHDFSEIQSHENHTNFFNWLPDEIIVYILKYLELAEIIVFSQTNRRHYELIAEGDGNSVLKYTFPFFGQSLTWHEMSYQFTKISDAQWEEIQRAIEGRILFLKELNIREAAKNIIEFKQIEALLNIKNIEKIKNTLYDHFRWFGDERESNLLLSMLSLTRFPLEQLFECKGIKSLFFNLTTLDLGGNKLCGPITKELGQFTKLVSLKLNDNQFSGPIPSELGRLTKLKKLSFSNNQLSGPIPSELGRLTNLKKLRLNDNQLCDSIPSELWQLVYLKILWLKNNQLSGPIPERFIRKFPDLVNSEGLIADQQVHDKPRLRP